MLNTIAAAPGTKMLCFDPGTGQITEHAIIAWTHVTGSYACPITCIRNGGLTHGRAVLHPGGMVDDPTHGLSFSDENEWLAFIRKAKPPKNSPPKDLDVQEGIDCTIDEIERNHDDTMAEAAEGPDEEEVEDEDGESPDVDPINFGTKTFKTNSFWLMPRDEFIFQIDGGQPYPKDDRCEKIKGDEFRQYKKDGYTVIAPESYGMVEDDEDEDDVANLV
jgi:hypothetical protein